MPPKRYYKQKFKMNQNAANNVTALNSDSINATENPILEGNGIFPDIDYVRPPDEVKRQRLIDYSGPSVTTRQQSQNQSIPLEQSAVDISMVDYDLDNAIHESILMEEERAIEESLWDIELQEEVKRREEEEKQLKKEQEEQQKKEEDERIMVFSREQELQSLKIKLNRLKTLEVPGSKGFNEINKVIEILEPIFNVYTEMGMENVELNKEQSELLFSTLSKIRFTSIEKQLLAKLFVLYDTLDL